MLFLIEYVVDMATAKICPTLAGFSLSNDTNQVSSKLVSVLVIIVLQTIFQDEWNTSLLLSSTKKAPNSPIHFTEGNGWGNFTTDLVVKHHIGGDPVQLNYSSDDGFPDVGPVPENFNDEFSVTNDHNGGFSDNFTAVNAYK